MGGTSQTYSLLLFSRPWHSLRLRLRHGCTGRDVRDVGRRPCLSDLHSCRTQAHIKNEGKKWKIMKEKVKQDVKKHTLENNERECVSFYQIWLSFLTWEYNFRLEKTEFVMNPVGLEALSDLKLFADGPFRFHAIHLWLIICFSVGSHRGQKQPRNAVFDQP